jgi:hypothetical protein
MFMQDELFFKQYSPNLQKIHPYNHILIILAFSIFSKYLSEMLDYSETPVINRFNLIDLGIRCLNL